MDPFSFGGSQKCAKLMAVCDLQKQKQNICIGNARRENKFFRESERLPSLVCMHVKFCHHWCLCMSKLPYDRCLYMLAVAICMYMYVVCVIIHTDMV